MAQTPVDLYKGRYLQSARHSTDSGAIYVSGIIRAQMKQVCYNVDICINDDGSIAESQCECAAGVGPYAHCKHVLVLLLAINDVVMKKSITTAEVCTQKLQTFHKPRRPFYGSPVKASHLKRRALSTPECMFDPRPQHLRNAPGYSDSVKNLCINYAATTSCSMPIMHTISPANPFAVENDHNYAGEVSTVLKKKLGLCQLTKEERDMIELTTRGQSKNEEWKAARSCRLTSSRFKDIICATERRDMVRLAASIADPPSFTSRATEHGLVNESKALNIFETMTGNVVQPCGLVIVETHSFLGASPDGLLCENTVIEVKCPFVSRHMNITPSTVPYLEYDGDELRLKRNHAYYYQIMGQLLATKRQYCDFIVHTYKETVVLSIARDDDFIDNMLEPLQKFYEDYFWPYLMDKYFYHGYEKLQFN